MTDKAALAGGTNMELTELMLSMSYVNAQH